MTERPKLIDGTGPVYVNGHLGLGDQIYARPFLVEVERHRDVYVQTAWPEESDPLSISCTPIRGPSEDPRTSPAALLSCLCIHTA